jgi:YD repeat-containing protein
MKLKLFCIALFIFPAAALADCVDTIHGSFCSQQQDLAQKSWDTELNLARVYHSRFSESGWFGHGWGTVYETRLIVMPDGSAVVEDPSTLKIARYGLVDPARLQFEVVKIVARAIEKERLDSAATVALQNQLLANEAMRRARVLQYGLQGQLPPNTRLRETGCPRALVERIATGYRRVTCEGGVDYFDPAGRLVGRERNGYRVTIHYAGEHPGLIEDTLGQKILFKWTPTGHVAEARTGKGESVISYGYDDNDNLILASEAPAVGASQGGPPKGETAASGAADNRVVAQDTRYTYDASHKLTRIDNSDGSRMEMKYDESGRLVWMQDTDLSEVAYAYRQDPANPAMHYWTTAKTPGRNGNVIISEAEYFLAVDRAGIERVARVIKTQGQEKEEITLDEMGRFTRIQKSDGHFSEFSYHPTLGRVAVVSTDAGRREMKYDRAGNLSRVKDDKGHMVVLSYDSRNRITRMVETIQAGHERRELDFSYNEHGKPVTIKMRGKGEISVVYGPDGEIAQVESKQGKDMPLEVGVAIKGMTDMAKVEGASLCL